MTYTRAILDFASAPHTLPPQVRADAERLLADTLAVGVAAAPTPEVVKLCQASVGWDSGSEARVFDGGMVPSQIAAFLNGFAIH